MAARDEFPTTFAINESAWITVCSEWQDARKRRDDLELWEWCQRSDDWSYTFFLFSSLSFIAYFNCAYAQDNSNNEEKNSAYDAGGYSLVLHASRHRKLHRIANAVIRRRIREHLEVVGPAADQIFHWNANFH